jgi:hypothetical protein
MFLPEPDMGRTKRQEWQQFWADVRAHEVVFQEKVLKIKTKDSRMTGFKLNPPQWKLEWAYNEAQRLMLQIFWFILKYRQAGSTTYFSAKAFTRTVSRENHVAHLSAHRKDRAAKTFRFQKQFYYQVPVVYRPEVDTMNKHELWFPDINSGISCASAGDGEGPRGDTLHTWIFTEAAYIAKNGGSLDAVLEAGLPALPENFWDIMLVLETTANGTADESHKYWLMSEKGLDGWAGFFLKWYEDPYYERGFHKHDEDEACQRYELEWGKLRAIRDACSTCKRLRAEFMKTFADDKLKERMRRYKLTPEQLHWYWLTLNKKFKGQLLKMQEAFPCDPKEAFIASGSPVFDLEVLNMVLGHVNPGKLYEPPIEATVQWDDLVPNEDLRRGVDVYLEVWREPKPNRRYVIGADSAEGTEKGNPTAAVILDLETMDVCAVLHGKIAPEALADYLQKLGELYNVALVAVEKQNTGVAVLSEMNKSYRNNYQKRRQTPAGWEETQTLGWDTNFQTKPWIVQLGRKMISAYKDDMKRLAQALPSTHMLSQYLTFTHQHLQLKAASGTEDDLVMAHLIALGVCHQELEIGLGDPVEKRHEKSEKEEREARQSPNVDHATHLDEFKRYMNGEEFTEYGDDVA